MATVNDLITSALRELGIVDVVETPGSDLSTLALGKLNAILDEWNTDRRAVYADAFSSLLPFTAGLNPHTIGISANSPTWTVTGHRPVTIEGIRITTDNGETFLSPLTKRDAAWWQAQTSPGTSSDYPSDFYFDPTWPNGSIYFSPEPSSASVKAQVWYRAILGQVATSDTFSLPPGYYAAVLETLKERLSELPMFASPNHGTIRERARVARAAAFGPNTTPAPQSSDLGLSHEGGARTYDYLTGPFSMMR